MAVERDIGTTAMHDNDDAVFEERKGIFVQRSIESKGLFQSLLRKRIPRTDSQSFPKRLPHRALIVMVRSQRGPRRTELHASAGSLISTTPGDIFPSQGRIAVRYWLGHLLSFLRVMGKVGRNCKARSPVRDIMFPPRRKASNGDFQ